MCHSDFVALYVYRALRKIGIRIPQQVAIMGYCGYPGGELLSPPLSTVDLFFENTGRDALKLMLESSKWWKPGVIPPLIHTPYKIIERGSTDIVRSDKLCAQLIHA
jgi:DNA-binding LacI/PurR family transcriptional regulator